MSTPSLPEFVYKIVPSAPPSILPDVLPLSDLDAADGFIHLSNAHQVPLTADLFFGASHTLWLLKVRSSATLAVGGTYQWVDGAPGCPHLYAEKPGEWVHLGRANVADVRACRRSEGETWAQALHALVAERWLVDA